VQFVPDNPLELLTQRELAAALEETGRVQAAEVLRLDPTAPPHQSFGGCLLYTWLTASRWADTTFPATEAIDWNPRDWVSPARGFVKETETETAVTS
jgi:hypothetical protein